MVLAKGVENEKGMVLCKEGMELTDAILFRLENAKIAHISVEGYPVKIEGESPVSEMIQNLHHRFQKVESIPHMMKIRELYEQQLKNRYGEEGNGTGEPGTQGES